MSQPTNALDPKTFLLQTDRQIKTTTTPNVGAAYIVDANNFAALDGVTCYTLEVWEECMRIPHWHPNASELGFVVSGSIEVIIWRSPGESAVFTLTAGMCWFIPQAALHSLNNIGDGHAKLLVGFSTGVPQDIDLPVAFNGVPVSIRDAYTSPHSELKNWKGVTNNPLLGRFNLDPAIRQVISSSPYGFDLAKVTPLFSDEKIGRVVWGVKDNWSILQNISVLRASLKPGVSRDAIWYPDAGTLYVVSQGKGMFHIVVAGAEPFHAEVGLHDYIFVPIGVLHSFENIGSDEFAVTAFFTKANPLPEVSLSVATGFFPKTMIRSAMTQYGTEDRAGNPLEHMRDTTVTPYLLDVSESRVKEEGGADKKTVVNAAK